MRYDEMGYNLGYYLKYIRWTGTQWTANLIEDNYPDYFGYYTSIVIDNYGFPHISYYDQTNGNLKYTWQVP